MLDKLLASYRNFLRLLAQTAIDLSLQGKADPSDLVQETLLKAYEHFGQFRGETEADFAAWLRQILVRTLADLVRRYKKAAAREVGRERSLERLLGDSSNAAQRVVASTMSAPDRLAAERELGVVLADALAALPADYRDVIVLRNIEELAWEEVAQRMERSLGAVHKLWTRALKQLRPLLEGAIMTSNPRAASNDSDLRLVRILDAYILALERGNAPAREQLLAEHPDLAADLLACLPSLEWLAPPQQ